MHIYHSLTAQHGQSPSYQCFGIVFALDTIWQDWWELRRLQMSFLYSIALIASRADLGAVGNAPNMASSRIRNPPSLCSNNDCTCEDIETRHLHMQCCFPRKHRWNSNSTGPRRRILQMPSYRLGIMMALFGYVIGTGVYLVVY